ncbi:MAG: AraC family transcriptional regulator [Phycisphaeraceae bacterium]
MERTPVDVISAWLEPWNETPHGFIAAVQLQIPFRAIAVGVPSAKPIIDELLVAQGWTLEQLRSWFASDHQKDRLFKAALKDGVSAAQPCKTEKDRRLGGDAHAIVVVVADAAMPKRWWWMILTRDQEFSALEQELACLMLRYWQMRYDLPAEPGMSRLLLGHDNRLILADLNTQARLLRQADLLKAMLTEFHPVVEQRFPDLTDNQTRDVVVKLDQQRYAAHFRRSRAADLPAAVHWVIEMHPLDADDLPAVGKVADERIAQAIAYIHNSFHESPSLADVARIVHISPFHFHRLFTRQVGISPKHYLQKKQLQVAKWLLRQGGVAIGDIAQRTGFSSHGHFTSTFHRVVGASPTDYRERA